MGRVEFDPTAQWSVTALNFQRPIELIILDSYHHFFDQYKGVLHNFSFSFANPNGNGQGFRSTIDNPIQGINCNSLDHPDSPGSAFQYVVEVSMMNLNDVIPHYNTLYRV